MDVFEAIAKRRSHKLLVEPAPSDTELRRILEAAAMAPDHQTLRPWRFVVIAGEAKNELSTRAVEQLKTKAPDTPAGKLEKEMRKLGRAPIVIAIAATHVETKLPFRELVSATDAAVQNLLLAATALGYGTIWRSGVAVDDPWLKRELGFQADDQVVGFIYIGTVPSNCPPPEVRPDGLRGTVQHYKAT